MPTGRQAGTTLAFSTLFALLMVLWWARMAVPIGAQADGWSLPADVSRGIGGSWLQAIASDSQDHIYVVWVKTLDPQTSESTIFFSRWDGTSWSRPTDAFPSRQKGERFFLPSIASGSDSVHLVWTNTSQLFYSRLLDQETWSLPYPISGAGRTYFSSITVDEQDNVYVVWEETPDPLVRGGWDIYYSRSTDGGRSWLSPINISNSPESSRRAMVAVDKKGLIHVVWGEAAVDLGSDLADEVFYSQSADGGQTWSKPTNISNSPDQDSGVPRLAVDRAGDVHVVFVESPPLRSEAERGLANSGRVYHRKWDGVAWSRKAEILSLPGRSAWSLAWPDVAIDKTGNIHIVATGGFRGHDEVYHAQSDDGGQTWSPPDAVPAPPGNARRPKMVISDDMIHVAWWAEFPYGTYIYYSRRQAKPLPATPSLPLLSPTANPTVTYAPTPTATSVPPTATPMPTPAISAEVTTATLNVRAGPGTNYHALGTVLRGQRMTVLARNAEEGTWLKVCCLDGQQGWISSAYVELDQPLGVIPVITDALPTPASTPTPSPATGWEAPTVMPTPTATPTPWPKMAFVVTPAPLSSEKPGPWSSPLRISAPGKGSWLVRPATDLMGNVHAVWNGPAGPGRPGAAVIHSRWNGQEWSKPAVILFAEQGVNLTIPVIATDNTGYVHVLSTDVWQTFYTKAPGDRAQSVASWSKPLIVSGFGRTYFSDIATDNVGNIHAVWEETLNADFTHGFDIYYSKSVDGGQTWSEPTNVSNSPETSRRATMAVDGRGVIHVAWAEEVEDGGYALGDEVFYSQSSDQGRTWSKPINMSNTSGPSGLPKLIVDGKNHVYLFWMDTLDLLASDRFADAGYLFYRIWNRSSWSAPLRVPAGGLGPAAWPDAAVDSGGNIHLVWMEHPASGAFVFTWYDGAQIFYSMWDGEGWTAPAKISRAAGGASRPRIAVSGGNKIHVVWTESPLGAINGEIYYASSQSSAPAVAPQPMPPTATPSPAPTITPSLTAPAPPSAAATPLATITVHPSATLLISRPSPNAPATIALPTGPLVGNQNERNVLLSSVVPVLGLLGSILLIRLVFKDGFSERKFRSIFRRRHG